jgi:drug/metabolite transporter (DMT)-like permease
MKDNQKAIIFILISALAFTLMSTMVKLAGNIPTYEKVFFRNLINFIIAIYIVKKNNVSFFGKKKNRFFLVVRGILGFLGVICNFYAVTKMNLSDATMIFNMTPFFVTLFAVFFLGEKILKIEYFSLVLAFIGVLLVIQPKFNIGIIPGLIGLLGAACAGGAYTLVSHINKEESPATIVFYFTFISVIITIPFMAYNFIVPNFKELLILIAVGIFATIGQFMVTLAYKYGKSNEVAIYNYTSIIFSILIGYFIWSEIPDKWSIIGSTILITTGINLYIQKRKKLLL